MGVSSVTAAKDHHGFSKNHPDWITSGPKWRTHLSLFNVAAYLKDKSYIWSHPAGSPGEAGGTSRVWRVHHRSVIASCRCLTQLFRTESQGWNILYWNISLHTLSSVIDWLWLGRAPSDDDSVPFKATVANPFEWGTLLIKRSK